MYVNHHHHQAAHPPSLPLTEILALTNFGNESVENCKTDSPRRTLLDEDEDRCKGERLLAIEIFPGLEISVSPELIGWEGPEPDPEPNSSPSEESEESPLKGASRILLARCCT